MISLDPHTLGEMLGDVRMLAAATDSKDAGVDLVQDAATRIDRVRLAVRGARPVAVAALEWLDPVFVAGHWTPQLIEYAGGIDVLGLAGEHSETRSWEVVREAAPEVVVVMPCGYDAERALEEAYDFQDELAELGARRIVAVDAAAYFSRPGPRLVDGLELLAHILHPDRVPEAPRRRRSRSSSERRPGARREVGRRRARRARSRAGEHGQHGEERRSLSFVDGVAGERAADQAADVAADRDVEPGEQEREGEVDEDRQAEPRLHRIDAAGAQQDDAGAHQPEDRARGADRELLGPTADAPNAPASSEAK